MTFEDAVREAGASAVVFYEHESKKNLTKDALPEGDIAVFVGAEGGFAEEEIELARTQGAAVVSLGKRILRTETASVVALALITYLAGETAL